jgi:hypothetical protein
MPIRYRVYKSDISAQSAEITIELFIKVHSGPAAVEFWKTKYDESYFYKTAWHDKPGVVHAVATAEVKDAWSRKINKCWGGVGVLWKGVTLQKVYKLKFQFAYVEDASLAGAEVACVDTGGEAYGVNPSGTIDAIRWGVRDTDPSTPGMICHEVGHLIGNPDEYYEIIFEGQQKNWGNGFRNGPQYGIMNNPNNPPLLRNYKLLARELIDRFQIPVDQAYLVPDAAMPSHNQTKYTDLRWDV